MPVRNANLQFYRKDKKPISTVVQIEVGWICENCKGGYMSNFRGDMTISSRGVTSQSRGRSRGRVSIDIFFEFWIRKVIADNEVIVGAGLWWVWRYRCNDIFNNGDQWSNYKVVAMARITANDLRKSARIGCVIRDSNGRWISGCSNSYPPRPIVRCELFAVWRSLILAWDYGLRDIVCETDSLDILHILKNSTNGLNCDVVDIFQKIQELLSKPWVVDFEWITRDANAVADWLARYAVKTNPTHVIWSEPCDELQHLMLVDLG
nr:uncharacterized protein LOC112803990 [Arachis hypogaea]